MSTEKEFLEKLDQLTEEDRASILEYLSKDHDEVEDESEEKTTVSTNDEGEKSPSPKKKSKKTTKQFFTVEVKNMSVEDKTRVARDYLINEFDMCIGRDNQLYGADKGSKIMKYSSAYLEEKVINNTLPDATIPKETAHKVVSEVYDILKERIENLEDRVVPLEPRISSLKGNTYIDTGSNLGVIKIDKETGDWAIDNNDKVYFRRTDLTGVLDVSFDDKDKTVSNAWGIFNHLNIPEELKPAVLSFIICDIVSPRGAKPVLYLQGKGGSGKTMTAELIKTALDPTSGGEILQGFSDDIKDLEIRYDAFATIIYDNITSIPRRTSEELCRLATGGGSIRRTLYTNDGLTAKAYIKKQILTSVHPVSIKPDLQSRLIYIKPAHILGYKTREMIMDKWEREIPAIRAGLLTLAAQALAMKNEIINEGKIVSMDERLADFYLVVDIVDTILKREGIIDQSFSTLEVLKGVKENLAVEAADDIIQFMLETDELGDMNGKTIDILTAVMTAADESGYRFSHRYSAKGFGSMLRDNLKLLSTKWNIEISKASRNGTRIYSFKLKDEFTEAFENNSESQYIAAIA